MALIIAFAAAIVVTPLAGRLALRTGVVDRPGPLKVHTTAVPYLGGLGVLAGTAVVAALHNPWVLVALVPAAGLGLVDDARSLPPRWRLAAEAAIGVGVGLLFATHLPPGLDILVVGAVVLSMINAVNLIDGLDGLAAGCALVSAAGFALVLGGSDRALALGVCGAAAGFLAYNRPPARIFLGDTGSYLLGASCAVLLVLAWRPGTAFAVGIGSLLFVAVPLIDTGVAVARRARARRPLFEGDRGHVYDQLVQRGWRPRLSTLALVAAQVVLSAVGVGATLLPAWAAAAVVAATSGAVALAVVRGGFLTWSPASTA